MFDPHPQCVNDPCSTRSRSLLTSSISTPHSMEPGNGCGVSNFPDIIHHLNMSESEKYTWRENQNNSEIVCFVCSGVLLADRQIILSFVVHDSVSAIANHEKRLKVRKFNFSPFKYESREFLQQTAGGQPKSKSRWIFKENVDTYILKKYHYNLTGTQNSRLVWETTTIQRPLIYLFNK